MIKDATINIRTSAKLKEKAQNTAQEIGMPLSLVINQLLRGFVKTKRAAVDFEAEEPSEWLKQQLKESEKDEKAGWVSPSFDNADDAIVWLNDKNRKYQNGRRDQ